MKVLLPVFLILMGLTACQSLPRAYDAPRSLPPTGALINLNQTLSVKPGSTRVYIQNGLAQDFSQIDIYQPWCQFFLHEHPSAMVKSRSIQPDQFNIVEAYHLMENFIAGLGQLASNAWIVSNSSGDDPGSRTLQSIMKLKSDKQPQVVQLKCAIYDDPVDFNYLSVEQMQKTLGQVVTMNLTR